MYKFIKVVFLALLALCLLGAVGCDSDSNGGGGTTTTGYTQADLAGRWNYVVIGPINGKGYIVIDASGNVTEAVARQKGLTTQTWLLGEGQLIVSPDGKVRGNFSYRQTYSPPAGSFLIRIRGFRLQFVSATKIDGAYANAQVAYPAGVYAGRATGPTFNITMEKQ